jgi:hypothetical protein
LEPEHLSDGREKQSPVSGLNGRPLAYKASALPLS